MQYIFSPDKKFRTWRKLWIALAETEQELGLPITDEQIAELKAAADDINYDEAKEREKIVRHDVMSHVYAYGLQCPKAKGIIHLGATSCYVTDNADILMLRDALTLVREKVLEVIRRLRAFALEYKDLPTLGYTHLQPAQLTTVGKRATLWMQDLLMDLDEVNFALSSLKLLGNRGATGTQESFMKLFDGDGEKVDELERRIARKVGMEAMQHGITGNGGGVAGGLGDLAGLGVTLGAMGSVVSMTKDALNPVMDAAAQMGRAVGGAIAPDGWDCPDCGQKGIASNFCPNCGAKMDGGNDND